MGETDIDNGGLALTRVDDGGDGYPPWAKSYQILKCQRIMVPDRGMEGFGYLDTR